MVSKRAAPMVSYSADPRVDLKVVLKAHKTAGKLVEWKDVKTVNMTVEKMVVSKDKHSVS